MINTAKYTMCVYEVIDELEKENKKLFDFDYDLSIPSLKSELEKMFVDKYYFREIGQETIDRFKNRLEYKWKMVLKEYNKKFTLMLTDLETKNLLATYEDNLDDTNKFNATPMSTIVDLSHGTSITNVHGVHSGYNGNIYKLATDILNNHSEIFDIFLSEFDTLFMCVL